MLKVLSPSTLFLLIILFSFLFYPPPPTHPQRMLSPVNDVIWSRLSCEPELVRFQAFAVYKCCFEEDFKMPMKGRYPIRRTLEYLQKGDIMFKTRVKIMTVNYNTHGELGDGARSEKTSQILSSSCIFLAFCNIQNVIACQLTDAKWRNVKRKVVQGPNR